MSFLLMRYSDSATIAMIDPMYLMKLAMCGKKLRES